MTLRFVIFTLSLGIAVAVLFGNWILLTDYATHRGVSLTNAVLLLSIGAIVDTVGRIMTGFLFDTPFLRLHRVQLFNFILLLNGAIMIGLAFAHHYNVMLGLTMIQFICSSVMMGQRQVIIVDLFGSDTFLTTLPFTWLMQGIGLLIIPSFLGEYI